MSIVGNLYLPSVITRNHTTKSVMILKSSLSINRKDKAVKAPVDYILITFLLIDKLAYIFVAVSFGQNGDGICVKLIMVCTK